MWEMWLNCLWRNVCAAPFVLSASGTSALFLSVSFVSSHFHPNQNPVSHFILISPLPLPIIISLVCVSPCPLLSPSFPSWSLSTVVSFLLHIISLFSYPILTLFNPFGRFLFCFSTTRLSAFLLICSMHVYFKEIDKFIPPRMVETSFWAYLWDLKHRHWWQVYACWCMLTKITANVEVCKGEKGGGGSWAFRSEKQEDGKEKRGEMVLHLNGVWKVANLAKGTQETLWTK